MWTHKYGLNPASLGTLFLTELPDNLYISNSQLFYFMYILCFLPTFSMFTVDCEAPLVNGLNAVAKAKLSLFNKVLKLATACTQK